MINFVFLLIYALLSGSLDAKDTYYLLTAQCIFLIFGYVQKYKIVFTPIFIYYLSIILVNYANLELLAQIGTPELRVSYLVPKYVNESAQLWAVSCTLVMLGYQAAARKSLPPVDLEINNAKTLKFIFWFLIALNALSLAGVAVRLGGGPVLKIMDLLSKVSILFFARLWALENNRKYRMYALSLFVLKTLVALTTAFLRIELILPTVFLFLGYFIGKGEIRYIFSYRVLPFILIFVVYSSAFKSLQSNRANFISVFTDRVRGDEEEKNSGALLARSANLPQMTNCFDLVRKNGFYGGAVSAPLVVALVPRVLWPDKPKIALGQWFALAITDQSAKVSQAQSTNSINMTIAGELYLDFGWLGVIIGSFLFGCYIPLLWNASGFYTSGYNITGTLFGGYLFFTAISGFGADLQIVITLLSTYLSLFILKKIAANIGNKKRPVVRHAS